MKVYLIGGGGYCKIGVSTCPDYRAHCIDNPKLPFEIKVLATYEAGTGANFVEKELHRHFKNRHMRGEWFDEITPEEFLHCAKDLSEKWIPPTKKEQKPDQYAGTVWGSMPSWARGNMLVALNNNNTPEFKKNFPQFV